VSAKHSFKADNLLGSPESLRRDIRWRPKFLQRLLDTEGDVQKAASAAGIKPVHAYLARADDPDFELDWDNIRRVIDEIRADQIEAATAERAVTGSPYTKYGTKGDVVETGTIPDTTAAVTMLKAYRPARFQEKRDPTAGETIQSFTDMVRALGEERRARAALGPAPVTAEAVIDTPALPAAPPLIRSREVN
jgi:hypothetical protein